jgi:hypothetical protein
MAMTWGALLGTLTSFLAALPLAVVLSAGHMTKGLAKFVSWAAFLPSALRHPDGITTATVISSKSVALPAALLSRPSVAMTGLVLIVAGLLFSIREARLARAHSATPYHSLLASMVFAALFLGVVCGIGLSS